jgi:hypothetical protein
MRFLQSLGLFFRYWPLLTSPWLSLREVFLNLSARARVMTTSLTKKREEVDAAKSLDGPH